MQPPAPVSSFDKTCTPPRAPVVDHGRFNRLSYARSHELRKRRGCNRGDSEKVPETRLASTGEGENKRIPTGGSAIGTLVTAPGKKGPATYACGGVLEWPYSNSGHGLPCGRSPLGLYCGYRSRAAACPLAESLIKVYGGMPFGPAQFRERMLQSLRGLQKGPSVRRRRGNCTLAWRGARRKGSLMRGNSSIFSSPYGEAATPKLLGIPSGYSPGK